MVFSSNIFLFLFLPFFLMAYYLTPFKWKSVTILVGSYIFYAWWRVDFLLLFFAVTLWNYYCGIAIARNRDRYEVKKKFLWLGVGGNLLTLGYFKYANFGMDSLNMLLTSVGANPYTLTNIILPIGISFYIFQAISYIIDVYREDTEPTERFIDFAAFISLFPQLIAGPVLRYKDLASQFSSRTHSMDKFSEGLGRFMQGFIKKVFIADSIAPLADNAFLLDSPSSADAWLGILAYTAQLYFDFSGYSDMAIGLGLMMGFRFVENFNQPYMSYSITEFWRRWHISLSTWLRDYLYIPLGGNRYGTLKTYRNLFLTMLLGGLWHGANWTFVFWGAWHGIWLAIERFFGFGGSESGFKPHRWLFTFIIVMIGWVAFRADSMSTALSMYHVMFFDLNFNLSELYQDQITSFHIVMLCLAYTIIFAVGIVKKFDISFGELKTLRASLYVASASVFLISVMKLAAENYSPFLYFQF